MNSIQVTVTVSEGKRLIARAISVLSEVKQALSTGRVLLKGGTTVSAVSEELAGMPLRISGRVTPQGTKTAVGRSPHPHTILIERGTARRVDDPEELEDAVKSMGPSDLAVLGANLVDMNGNAAMMAGAELGGPPGRVLSGLTAQGTGLIIAAGLEKLSPVDLGTAIRAAGRTRTKRSMGMSVGLMPIFGRVITEVQALAILGATYGESPEIVVVGRGGIAGAEGGTTLVLTGEDPVLDGLWAEVLKVKGATHSGDPASLKECSGRNAACGRHLACIYGRGEPK